MNESERIVGQMRKAFGGDAWSGVSVLATLVDVHGEEAAEHPVAEAHSIWEVVLHLSAVQGLVLRRFAGDAAATDLAPEEDWPVVGEVSEAAWRNAVDRLTKQELKIRAAAEPLDDAALLRPWTDGGTTFYDNLHGYVQHNLYHAGQIALLKRALRG